jgi:23S rRNA-/tRNA-specific pseudouridylate synthase
MARDGRVRFRVVVSEDGLMLRQLICRRFAEFGVQAAADLIKAGGVYVDNVRIRIPAVRVAKGERITVYRAAASTVALDPDDLEIIHRDPDFVVVLKPAGVPARSTRTSARGTVAQALVHRLCAAGHLRPYVGPVRPLPPGASGLVLYTIRDQDAVSHQPAFVETELVTVDRLVVEGEAPTTLRCDEPVLMGRSGRLKAVPPDTFGARPARTDYRLLERRAGPNGAVRSLLEATATRAEGAQAIVHAAALGFPVVRGDENAAEPATEAATGGDPYREGEPAAGVTLLHRAKITLVHPLRDETLVFEAPPPPWAQTADERGGAN